MREKCENCGSPQHPSGSKIKKYHTLCLVLLGDNIMYPSNRYYAMTGGHYFLKNGGLGNSCPDNGWFKSVEEFEKYWKRKLVPNKFVLKGAL